MKTRWIIPFLLFGLNICIHTKEKNLVVSLPTQHSLISVVVNASSNLNGLRKIVVNDLNLNGSCIVEKENTLSKYIINMELIDHELLVSIKCQKNGFNHTLPLQSISTSPSFNRCAIHKISDQLTKIITGVKGIASTKILFAIQNIEKSNKGIVYKSEIWESDYDGENQKQVTNESNYCISPVFFPVKGDFTEHKFLYVTYKQGQPKIYLGSFKDNKGTPFIILKGNQFLPAISKKGNMIAFISDVSGRADLFTQTFSHQYGLIGKPIQIYSYPHSVQASPTFRPDGKKLAFVSDKEGTPRIYLIDTPIHETGKRLNPICITKKYRQNICPSWSSDGTKLAYSAMIDGSRQIMIYDFLSKEEIQLTTGTIHKENPSWASNSLHLIYNTVDSSSSELFIIDIKQKKPVQITSGPGKKHYPAWEPHQT